MGRLTCPEGHAWNVLASFLPSLLQAMSYRSTDLPAHVHQTKMRNLALLFVAVAASDAFAERLPPHVLAAKRLLFSFFEWFGELGLFCRRLIRAALTPPYEFSEFLRQCDAIGSKSLPLVALAGAATGVVMSLQTRDSLIRFGAKAFL